MSSPVSLLTLRTKVRELADLGPDATTGRYPNARLNAYINDAWQIMREHAIANGNGLQFLKQTTPANMTVGAINANSLFGSIPLPADCVTVNGIDVRFSTTDIRPLEAVSWNDRNQWPDLFGNNLGRPVGFCLYNTGLETTTTVSLGAIAIMPAPDNTYSYTIWYTPTFIAKVNDTDVFDGIAGWQQWVIADAALKSLTGDNDSSAAVGALNQMKAEAEAIITKRANTLQRVGPSRRRPVREQSNRNRARSLWRLP